MTTQELIERLKILSPNTRVLVWASKREMMTENVKVSTVDNETVCICDFLTGTPIEKPSDL